MNTLETSLYNLLHIIKNTKNKIKEQGVFENDKNRVLSLLNKLRQNEAQINNEEKINNMNKTSIMLSYSNQQIVDKKLKIEQDRINCNSIYLDIKKEYENNVFEPELLLYELFIKIKDVETLIDYIKLK